MNNNKQGYKKLKVWVEANKLVIIIYQITKKFPRDELFGLTSQARRSAVSLVANIIEGQARKSKKEFLQFLSISNGSLVELEYYLELSLDLKYISSIDFNESSEQLHFVGILLHGLIKSLKSSLTH